MYSHKTEEKNGKLRVIFTYTGDHPFVESFDMGFFDSEVLALEAVEQAKILHAEDLNDPTDKPENRLERFIDAHYRASGGN